MIQGATSTVYYANHSGAWHAVDGAVVDEMTACLYVNGQETAAFMCSPTDLEALALGFLRTEGLICGLHDIELIRLAKQGTCVDVWLRYEVDLPRRAIRTSGCGGGMTFDDLLGQRAPLSHSATVSAQQVIDRYFDLRAAETVYPVSRGIHASGLCTAEALLLLAEDVGRHNTMDKLVGKAMQQGIDMSGCMVVTTGRISAEMLGKAAKVGIPLVASRTSPTSRSLALAQAWNITVVGYVRRDSLRVYTAPERIGLRTERLQAIC